MGGCLLRVHFYRLGSVSELLQLAEDLLGLPLELLLKHFKRLLVVELLTHHHSGLVAEQRVYLVENVFGGPAAVLEIHVDARLREVAQHKDVVLLELLGYHSGQDRFVIRDEVVGRLLLPKAFHGSLPLKFV